VTEFARSGISMFACFFDGEALGQSAAAAISTARTGWGESEAGS
jgi:hypothetical protein